MGLLSIAPARAIIGEDLTLFWLVLVLGALFGGPAALMSLRDPALSRRSPVGRWSLWLFLWSIFAFCAYPIYALILGLPLDFLRASMSFLVSLLVATFFFLGIELRRSRGSHAAFLAGVVGMGLGYLAYMMFVLWETGNLFSSNLIEVRIVIFEYIPTWPSRYPVILIMLTGVALALSCQASLGRSRVAACLAAALFAAATVFSLTRGAWVGLLFAVAIYIIYRLPGWKTCLAAACLVITLSAGTDLQRRSSILFTPDGTLENSSAVRVAIWKKAFSALLQSPAFGYGQQGTGVVLGDVETDLEVVSGAAAHNDFVDMAIRAGLPGLAIYFLIALALFRYGLQASRNPHTYPSAYLVVGLMGALGYGFFHELLRFPLSGALFWYLTGSLASEQAELATPLEKNKCAA